MGNPKWVCVSLLAVLLLTGGKALAQVEIVRPTAGEKNAVALSAVVGPNLTQDNYFYGVAAEYDRLISEKWEFAASFGAGWVPLQPGKNEQTLSFSLTGGYALTNRLSLDVAYAKEIARYDAGTSYRWKWANGDNAIGVGASYTLWERARHTLDISVGVERNVTASETSINFELGYGFSF
jgi:hypothetical protein